MRLAKRAGHQVVGVNSDYTATNRFEEAVVWVCQPGGFSMLELAGIDAVGDSDPRR